MAISSKKLRFTVGFSGNNALIDRKLYRQARRMSAQQLLDQGLLTYACRLAWEQGDTQVLRQIGQRLRLQCDEDQLPERLARIFGLSVDLSKVSSVILL